MSKLTTIDKLIDIVGLTIEQGKQLYYDGTLILNDMVYLYAQQTVCVYNYPMSEGVNKPKMKYNLDNY